MADCDHDQPMTPEMDATVARVAMAEGDLKHAAHHVAGALASDPHRPDLLQLLDQLVAAAGGPAEALGLFSLEGGTWFGAAAIHARLLAETDPGAALDLLCQVAAARPDVPYLRWAGSWLPRIDPTGAGSSFSRLLAINADAGSPPVENTLVPALELLGELRETHPDVPLLWSISSMVTRRAWRLEDALSLARTAFERFPSWNSAVALANACKQVRRIDLAEEAWTAALRFDPDDVSVRLDWADTLLDHDDLDRSREKYQEVLDRQPAHPWALPSAAYVDWLRDPTVHGRLALAAYAARHPDNGRARSLADRATPWLAWLPGPSEATLNGLSSVRQAQEPPYGQLTMALSGLESPSSQWAARRFVADHGGTLTLSASSVPNPDPRSPIGDPRWTFWRWDDTIAEPAVGEPRHPQAATVLAKVASWWYHSGQWLANGVQVARSHGLGDVLTEDVAEDLVRAALHPPPGPDWCVPWVWRYRLAHAAAFVAAGYPGWEGTVQRELLRSMLATRNDWLAVAAAAVAGERGQQDDAREELIDWLGEALRERPDGSYWCVGWPASCALERLQTDEGAREELIEALSGWEPGRDA